MLNKKNASLIIVLILVLLKLYLVRNQQILAIVISPHDDRHFIDQAASLLHGNWLGPYNQYTLIKGPFFPLWIALTFVLGIPLLLSNHLLYIFACLVLTIALRPALRRTGYPLILLAALLFNPFTYDPFVFTRATRDGIYSSLCVLVIACTIALFLRKGESRVGILPWIVGLGLALSAAALTREETVWLLPPLLLVIVLSLLKIRDIGTRNLILRLGLWALIPTMYLLSIGLISALNYHYYSVFHVTEMGAPEFVSAFSALQRVTPEQFTPMVPVSKETRMRIYSVSPAFKELEPLLEGYVGNAWASTSVPDRQIPEGEIPGGWFMWAFRDAVSIAGHYSAGKFPADYYRALAYEVNTACDSGQLVCTSKPNSLAPAWNNAYITPIINSFLDGSKIVVTFSKFNPYPIQSNTDSGQGELLFRDLTQTEVSLSDKTTAYEITGWAVSENEPVYTLITSNGQDNSNGTTISISPSPDVYDAFLAKGENIPGARLSRFDIKTSCAMDCSLEIRSPDETLTKFNLKKLHSSTSWNNSQTFVVIDSVQSSPEGLMFQNKYNQIKTKVLDKIGQLYQLVFPPTTILAILAFVLLPILAREKLDTWLTLFLLLISVILRIGLLSVIDITSFPALIPLYLSPAYPLIIAFTSLALITAFDSFVQRKRPALNAP